MSLESVKNIFLILPDCVEWHAHLLKYTHSKRNGTIYNCRRIELEPRDRLLSLVSEISSEYTKEGKNKFDKYVDVREYDGTCSSNTIYSISESNNDVIIDLDSLFQGIANTDSESNPLEMDANAYVLCGSLMNGRETHQIKLISMMSPISTLKNHFMHEKGKFIEISNKVLNLRTTINVVILDRTVYFLDMSGESLFNMERAYRLKCNESVDDIEGTNIISDTAMFRDIATSGHNPRRFVSFSKTKLHLLEKKKNREKVAMHFDVALTNDKLFDTSKKEDAEKLVKVLCGKAMWDILEEVPVEVDGSKEWER